MSYNGGAAALKEWCERRAEHKEHQARQTAGRNWPESEILADDAAKLREIAALLPRTCDRCGKELGKDADAYCQGHGEPPDAPRAPQDADAGRQRCPKCGRLVRVRRNGNLYAHRTAPSWPQCPYPQEQYSPREV